MARSLGGIGTWAEEADREEAERKEAQAKIKQQQEAEAAALAVNVSKQRKKKNPTYSLSEVTTGQHVGPGGRSRSIPDNRIFPFPDRNPRAAAGFEPRSIDRRREAVPVYRADQADYWSSFKKAAGGSVDQFPATERRNERRNLPSQDERKLEDFVPSPSESQEETKQVRVRSDPFAGARPREEVLAAKFKDKAKDTDGVSGGDKVSDVAEGEKVRVDDERSSSSSSISLGTSRPPTPGVPEFESHSVPQKKKANPFGEARPREALLEERGVDWRKKDLQLEHRSVDRSESEKERKLKEEIRQLEERLRNEGDRDNPVDGTDNVLDREHVDNLRAMVIQKENELQELTLALDDMVRFPQKQVQRPISQSGRSDHSVKLALGSDRSDTSRGYNPEMLSTLSLSAETTREPDAQRPNFSSRDKDISRGFESGRHGGIVRSFDRPDVRVSSLDRPGSRSGSGDFPGDYDVSRPGIHPGHTGFTGTADSGWPHSRQWCNDHSRGNGFEGSQSSSGHTKFMRGYTSERRDLRSQHSNISQGFNSERPTLHSRHGDAQAYDPERSGPGPWDDDYRVYESERAGVGFRKHDVRWNESARRRPNSRGSDTIRGLAPERTVSLSTREFRGGSDIAGPSSIGGRNEARKISVFDRLGPPLRAPSRGYDNGRGGSRPGFVDARKDPDLMDWQFSEEGSGRFRESGRLNTAHEHERRESWPGQADIRRGYDTNRGSERSSSDQFPYKVGTYREDLNRGRNYGQKEYYRRGNYTSQDKFEKPRGIRG